MPTDEIRLPALEAAIEGYEDAVAMLPSKYGKAAHEELRLVLEVLHAAQDWRTFCFCDTNPDEPCMTELSEKAERLRKTLDALAALRSVR